MNTHKTEYTYDKDNRPTEVKYNGSNSTKVNYTYDKLNRVMNRTVTNGAAYSTQFGYVQGAAAYGSNATTPLVQSITQGQLYNRKKKSTERYNDYGGGLLFLSHRGVQNAVPGVFCDVTRLKSNCSHLNFVDVNSSGTVM